MTKTEAQTAPGESMHYMILNGAAKWIALCNGCWGCRTGMDVDTFMQRHGRKRIKRVWEIL